MLLHLGKRAPSEDLVDLLAECHGRIRKFMVMARRLALASMATPAEIAETGARIHRYFSESFPLHLEDEELDIAPRLRDTREVRRICADHRAHADLVKELVGVCGALATEPRQHAALAPRLEAIVRDLSTELEAHLELEETTIFPVLRALPEGTRTEIVTAMQRRRARALGMQ